MRAFGLVFIFASLVVAGAACENKKRNNSDDDDATSVTVGAGGGGGAMQDPDAPQFVSFEANVTTLYDGHSITFNAVVSDPQGAGDVVGGVLRDAQGGDYGAFVKTGDVTYSITLTWEEINALAPIDFPYGSSQARDFVAEFFDVADHRSSTQVTVTLTCANGLAGCAGSCTDTLNDDFNCGGCGESCNDEACNFGNYCQSGTCAGGEQVDCSDWDDVCVVGTCNPQNGSCDQTPVANNTACNDLDSCTSGDVCNGGICGGSTITSCIHNDGCCPTVCTSSNDNDCGVGCNATNLGSLSPQSTSGSTTSATNTYSGSCGGSSAPERIYVFTAPSSGLYTIDTIGSSFDTILHVRNSSCGGSELGCNDDGGGGTASLVSLSLSTGQSVYIFVDGYSTNSGSFVLNVSGP